jgi:hypothetical protein
MYLSLKLGTTLQLNIILEPRLSNPAHPSSPCTDHPTL